jgi:hypothetical protein
MPARQVSNWTPLGFVHYPCQIDTSFFVVTVEFEGLFEGKPRGSRLAIAPVGETQMVLNLRRVGHKPSRLEELRDGEFALASFEGLGTGCVVTGPLESENGSGVASAHQNADGDRQPDDHQNRSMFWAGAPVIAAHVKIPRFARAKFIMASHRPGSVYQAQVRRLYGERHKSNSPTLPRDGGPMSKRQPRARPATETTTEIPSIRR